MGQADVGDAALDAFDGGRGFEQSATREIADLDLAACAGLQLVNEFLHDLGLPRRGREVIGDLQIDGF